MKTLYLLPYAGALVTVEFDVNNEVSARSLAMRQMSIAGLRL